MEFAYIETLKSVVAFIDLKNCISSESSTRTYPGL